jgi:hypothetical protein
VCPAVSRLLLSRARHRPHPYLLLRRIRRSIIREILANAPAVGSKSIDKWRVAASVNITSIVIVTQRAPIEVARNRWKEYLMEAAELTLSDLAIWHSAGGGL